MSAGSACQIAGRICSCVVVVALVLAPSSGRAEVRTELILPKLCWTYGDRDEQVLIGRVWHASIAPSGETLVLDGQASSVHRFSSSGQHIKSIGRSGEGPGEFQVPSKVFHWPQGGIGVLQLAPPSIVRIAQDGEALETIRLFDSDAAMFQAVVDVRARNDTLVVLWSQSVVEGSQLNVRESLSVLDSNGRLARTIITNSPHSNHTTGGEAVARTRSLLNSWELGSNGTVYVAPHDDKYEVVVYSQGGEQIRSMGRSDYQSLARDAVRMRRLRDAIGRNELTQTKLSSNERDVLMLFERRPDELWVLSSRGYFERSPGTLGTLDVFDSQGGPSRQLEIHIPFDPETDRAFYSGDHLLVVHGGGQSAGATEKTHRPHTADSVVLHCYELP